VEHARIVIWQGSGGFAGEDLHRLAHRRVGPMLAHRLGDRSPEVVHRRGALSEAVPRSLDELRPQVIVLPAFREQLRDSLVTIRDLARLAPDVPVFLSGWGADPEYLDALEVSLDHPRLVVARGEPEEALVDGLELLCTTPRDTLPRRALADVGLALPTPGGGWESRGRFRRVDDLDTLPSVFGTGVMTPGETDGTALVEVARGCRFRCGFCLSCNFEPRGVRAFPASSIGGEIRHAARAGATSLALLCSALNHDVELLEEVVSAVQSAGSDRPLEVESTVHASLLDERRLRAISRLRWRRMIVGLQSTNPAALRIMGRNVDPARFARAVERLAEVHPPVVEVILGLPGDTLQGFVETVKLVLALPAHVEVYHLRLDPGSRFMAERGELGLEADFSSQGRVISTPTFTADEVRRARLMLERLASRPWRFRALSLGLDFVPLHPAHRG
jgi:radical SAM superfamily enzyme YgiQ (UPF0313 family)